MVATTSHPAVTNVCAMARPKPDEQPVMSILGMYFLLTIKLAKKWTSQLGLTIFDYPKSFSMSLKP
jgi:hypothetical protein